MFSFLRPRPEPVAPSVPEPSNKERIAKIVDEATTKLAKINKAIDEKRARRSALQDEMKPLYTRITDLEAAITHAEAMLEAGPESPIMVTKINDLADIARQELQENLTAQEVIRAEIDSINSFLETSLEQVSSLTISVNEIQNDFSNLDIRETESIVRREIGQIDELVRGYRLEVFTSEARAELAQS